MNHFTIGRALAFGASLFLLVVPTAQAQQEAEWTWKDAQGRTRARSDLDSILREHKLWVESKQSRGKQADLHGADLHDAKLVEAELSRARLGGTEMTVSSNVDEGFSVRHVEWTKPGANLSDADLSYANLTDSEMYATNLRRANLDSANLSDAALDYSSFVGASLENTELKGAIVREADFKGAVFEPTSLPEIRSIAAAKNLEFLTYENNPDGIVQLRKHFQDDGFRLQERKLTYAIKREEAERSREDCTSRTLSDGTTRAILWSSDSNLSNCASFVLNRVFFDLTCQYGMSPGRPLSLGVLLWLLCSLLYFSSIRTRGQAGLYRVYAQGIPGDATDQRCVERITPPALTQARAVRRLLQFLLREWAILRASMFFSLMSAFNIGFRDINFGRWLRLLTRQEFDMKAVGWARVVAGWQSLISVYFIALWLLTYFGRPFG